METPGGLVLCHSAWAWGQAHSEPELFSGATQLHWGARRVRGAGAGVVVHRGPVWRKPELYCENHVRPQAHSQWLKGSTGEEARKRQSSCDMREACLYMLRRRLFPWLSHVQNCLPSMLKTSHT